MKSHYNIWIAESYSCQKDIIELHHDFEPIPVLYFTQLMAFLFDLGEESYGFEQNYIDPKKVLNRKELVSN